MQHASRAARLRARFPANAAGAATLARIPPPIAGIALAGLPDMLLKRILVPVDFSGRSRAALSFALGLAREQRADIELLHVLPAAGPLAVTLDAWSGRPMPHAGDGELLDAKEQLEALLSSVDHQGVTMHQKIEEGDAAASIVRIAVEDAVDLIVVGTHGRAGLAGLIHGSVARTLLSCAPCPVLTLRDDGAHSQPM
jgi:nucleotide-binding universal stress UspA family protein